MTEDLQWFEERKVAITEYLTVITNRLIEMAHAAGRTRYTKNQLLRECYNLQDCELKTLDEWHALGRYVKRSEHAYLFWSNNGEPIMKFADWQLQVEARQLSITF